MSGDLLTVNEVADRLGLHVRTVRNYIRDGQLKAVRVGKQYRIARADLEAFTGLAPGPEPATRRHRHVGVSSIVEVDAISREESSRLSTLLMGATVQQRGGHEPMRIETVYDEERAHLKIIVLGGLAASAELFRLIGMIIEERK